MGGYRRIGAHRAARRAVRPEAFGRHTRSPYELPVFAFFAAIAFVVVLIIAPDTTSSASAAVIVQFAPGEVQTLAVNGTYDSKVTRDSYAVSKKQLGALPSATGDAAAAQAIAYTMVKDRGWSDDEFACLVRLFDRESHWNVFSANVSSGAYGIPQALPGTKMASAGADWETNPATQISWGLGYIAGRYGTPCGAWDHSETKGWY